MEVDEKKLEERKNQIESQIRMMQSQLQQAVHATQQLPLSIAVIQGELNAINKLLKEKENATKGGKQDAKD